MESKGSIKERLSILTAAAKYDMSCASGCSSRSSEKSDLGNIKSSGVYHSLTDDGRCISLLKLLLTNDCIYDCSYCANRRSRDTPRASFTSREVADITAAFYKRNYIGGLFLSSAVRRSPDDTMLDILRTVWLLRNEYHFNGYIHAKVIPGASHELVEALGRISDRISVNIEFPTEKSLSLLAPQKSSKAIFAPMRYISARTEEANKIVRRTSSGKMCKPFAPEGQSTQLIVGATPDTDRTILSLSEALYSKLSLKRVYYSAYMPINEEAYLPAIATAPPLLREHRLYQADWLLRYYGFRADEILDERNQNLNDSLDPKSDWALRHMDFFPVDVNKADYEALLRVPGLGVTSAKRILTARRARRLNAENLKKLGVVMKRAVYFLSYDGRDSRLFSTSSEKHLRAFLSSFPKPQQLLIPFAPI